MSIFESLFKSRTLKKCEELETKVNQLEIDLNSINQLLKDLNSKMDVYKNAISKSIDDSKEQQSLLIESEGKEMVAEIYTKLEEICGLISEELKKTSIDIGEVKVSNVSIKNGIVECSDKIDEVIDDHLLEQISENRQVQIRAKDDVINKCESLSNKNRQFYEKQYEELSRKFDDVNQLLKLILANELVDQIAVFDNK